MKKLIKLINIVSIIFVSSFLSISLSLWISEKYFFDKFYFNKSVAHGYWPADRTVEFKEFGKRSEDIILTNKIWGEMEKGKVLGKNSEDDHIYTISLHGDSYVWGQGVKNSNLLSTQIERQLNSYYPTEVISMGVSGNSILELYKNSYISNKVYNIDLFIFVPVVNDLLLLNNADYEEYIPFWTSCKNRYPDLSPIYDWTDEEHQYIAEQEDPNKLYEGRVTESWQNDLNLCLLEESLKRIPAEKSIFFIPDYFYDDATWEEYLYYIKKYHNNIVYVQESKEIPEYQYLWEDIDKYFYVSEKDHHPSKDAHKMYADIISREIISNEKYNFLLK